MSETCEIHITLTEEEHLAAKSEMINCQEWAENAIKVRCNTAGKNIVKKYIDAAMENGWTIPNTRIEIIKEAYAKGVVKDAETQNRESQIIQ
jgi:hypothetical protein